MRIIDTNYALRYLLQDNYNQAMKAKEILDEGVYILPESIVEIVYVLSKVYKIERKEISFAILDLLEDVEMIDKQLYVQSIKLYSKTKLDYVDCVLVARNQIFNDKIYSFDDKLNKEMLNNWSKENL